MPSAAAAKRKYHKKRRVMTWKKHKQTTKERLMNYAIKGERKKKL